MHGYVFNILLQVICIALPVSFLVSSSSIDIHNHLYNLSILIYHISLVYCDTGPW